MAYETVKRGDQRRRLLLGDWKPWLEQMAGLYDRYLLEEYPSPFSLHEQATVGLLVSAAARAGFINYNEYEIIKKGRGDKRRRVSGRADFWMDCNGRGYSFEVKRAYIETSKTQLRATMRSAITDAECICEDECDQAVGLVLAYMNENGDPELYETFSKSEDVSFAYRFGPRGKGGAFLFFSLVGR
jgi:hypothetical protein